MSDYNINVGTLREIKVISTHVLADTYTHPTIIRDSGKTWVTLDDIPANTPLIEGAFWSVVFNDGFIFRGLYDITETYEEFEVVKYGSGAFKLNRGYQALPGDVPDIATGKWTCLFTASGATYAPNSILLSDSNGDMETLPITLGQVKGTGTGWGDMEISDPAYHPNDVKFIRYLGERTVAYGSAHIRSDDTVVTNGYATTNLVHLSRTSSYELFNAPLTEDTPHTGSWIGVVISYYNLFAWTTTGELYGVGINNAGQLGLSGDTDLKPQLTKLPISDVKNVITSSKADSNTMTWVIKNDGTVWFTGYNSRGAGGQGNTTAINTWTQVPLVGKAASLSAGNTNYASVAVVMEDSTQDNLYTWGYNGTGECGLGNTTMQTTPVLVPGMRVKQAIMGSGHSSHGVCMVALASGEVMGAGYNTHATLGDGTTTHKSVFTQVNSTMAGVVKLSMCDAYAGTVYATVKTPGELYVWGYNGYGQLGNGTTTMNSTPQLITLPTDGVVIKVVTPLHHQGGSAMALTSKGEVFFCGRSYSHQSGDGNSANVTTWTKMPTGHNRICDISVGGNSHNQTYHLLTEFGDLYTTGYNGHGQRWSGETTSTTMISKANI